MSFVPLFCLTAVARTPNTVLNRGDGGHPRLVPDLRGKAFSFSPLSVILARSLYGLSYIERDTHSFFTHFVEFLSSKDVEFRQMHLLR